MAPQDKSTRACIIGAGCSGFTMAKRLLDYGVEFDCFDLSDDIGGNWYYNNPNGMSSCYQSLHIDTSKWLLAFEDFPIPEDWPDFPHHRQILRYFHDYVTHFGLREHITFNTGVDHARRCENGDWEVSLSNGQTRIYQWLIVCNGHHWSPRMPEYPGQDEFTGYQVHSHHYRDPFEPYDFRGKKVLVVGAGNSAMDISSELSQKPIADELHISMRRGVWVLPKYFKGQPLDKMAMDMWIPAALRLKMARYILLRHLGNPESYGLPKPDHQPLEAHPSISSEFLTRVGSGDIIAHGAMERLEQDSVVFSDGSRVHVDAIIWATGYNIHFPFFDDPALTPKDNEFPLFKRMFKPGYDNLIFLGLAQALPTLVNFAEQQSKLAAKLITREYTLPEEAEMHRITHTDESAQQRQVYPAARHTMQVQFDAYVKDLHKEITRGRKRSQRSQQQEPVL